jgi:phosphoserine phosphatase
VPPGEIELEQKKREPLRLAKFLTKKYCFLAKFQENGQPTWKKNETTPRKSSQGRSGQAHLVLAQTFLYTTISDYTHNLFTYFETKTKQKKKKKKKKTIYTYIMSRAGYKRLGLGPKLERGRRSFGENQNDIDWFDIAWKTGAAVVTAGTAFLTARWLRGVADTSSPESDAKIHERSPRYTVEETQEILKSCDAVCFDVDSTVVQDEGINVLADFCGVGEEVSAYTTRAMNGHVLFQDALRERLSLINPSRQQVALCLKDRPFQLTPHIEKLVILLRSLGKQIFLVSGGFVQMIYPVADQLEIQRSHVIANVLLFDQDTGAFAGFDEDQPTSRTGGKNIAVSRIKADFKVNKLVMIGDGVTDMEADAADAFIGFGGVCARDAVKAGADWFITDFDELIKILSPK